MSINEDMQVISILTETRNVKQSNNLLLKCIVYCNVVETYFLEATRGRGTVNLYSDGLFKLARVLILDFLTRTHTGSYGRGVTV
jgi:hypothetical protein